MVTCVSQSLSSRLRAAQNDGSVLLISLAMIDPTECPSSSLELRHFANTLRGVQAEMEGCGRVGLRMAERPSRTTEAQLDRASNLRSISVRDQVMLMREVALRSSQTRMSLYWKRVSRWRQLVSVRGMLPSIFKYSKTFVQLQSYLEWVFWMRVLPFSDQYLTIYASCWLSTRMLSESSPISLISKPWVVWGCSSRRGLPFLRKRYDPISPCTCVLNECLQILAHRSFFRIGCSCMSSTRSLIAYGKMRAICCNLCSSWMQNYSMFLPLKISLNACGQTFSFPFKIMIGSNCLLNLVRFAGWSLNMASQMV